MQAKRCDVISKYFEGWTISTIKGGYYVLYIGKLLFHCLLPVHNFFKLRSSSNNFFKLK